MHARITADAVLEDAGSSHGTWLDGVRVTGPSPLRDGAKIRLGDAELRVERRRESTEAGRTIVVPRGRGAGAAAAGAAGTQFGMKPRVRSGYALKRLDASEGRKRWVLRDLASGTFLRLSDNDAGVFQMLDGTHSLVELVGLCRAALRADRPGAAGAAADRPRRARLPRGRGRRAAGRASRRRSGGGGWSSRARRSSAGVGPRDRGALPARRLGVLHAAGADRRWPC